jgi:hypothetical protein
MIRPEDFLPVLASQPAPFSLRKLTFRKRCARIPDFALTGGEPS